MLKSLLSPSQSLGVRSSGESIEVWARYIPAKSLYHPLKDIGLYISAAIRSLLERLCNAALADLYQIWLGGENLSEGDVEG